MTCRGSIAMTESARVYRMCRITDVLILNTISVKKIGGAYRYENGCKDFGAMVLQHHDGVKYYRWLVEAIMKQYKLVTSFMMR